MSKIVITLIAAVFCAAAAITWIWRRIALARAVLDVPNARSSHAVAMPRGGGVAIAVTMLVALPFLVAMNLIGMSEAIGCGVGGAAIAGIGLIDDHQHVASRVRLVVHVLGATWFIGWIGGAPPIQLLGPVVASGWIANVAAVLYIVWVLNLTNFMDGIDGIAATETVTVVVGASIVWAITHGAAQATAPALVLAAASLGFLVWNWPPAKIFMGDVGSGFVGFMMGAMSIIAGRVDPAMFWAWLVLLGVFVVDATTTIVRRALRREQLDQPHRGHAYQRAARLAGGHRPVTVAVAAINLMWLLPIAIVVGLRRLPGFPAVLLAYAPLLVLALRLGAGRREDRVPAPASKE